MGALAVGLSHGETWPNEFVGTTQLVVAKAGNVAPATTAGNCEYHQEHGGRHEDDGGSRRNV